MGQPALVFDLTSQGQALLLRWRGGARMDLSPTRYVRGVAQLLQVEKEEWNSCWVLVKCHVLLQCGGIL